MDIKTEVLKKLEENRGGVLSGEAMAAELGISRASVWKAVKTLRQDGYPIEAATNRG
ncbi:MAG: HTH domain-containing protein, partial [Clostridiales Family XIII bacterium]|nr:HTH domain-containing protein [Clostridiales Family XIII bacterium]